MKELLKSVKNPKIAQKFKEFGCNAHFTMPNTNRNFTHSVHKKPNGALFVGEVDNVGVQNGYCIGVSADGNEIIEAYFLNSHIEGYGRTIQLRENDIIVICECRFSNSKIDGPAKIHFSDGTEWVGFFKNDS